MKIPLSLIAGIVLVVIHLIIFQYCYASSLKYTAQYEKAVTVHPESAPGTFNWGGALAWWPIGILDYPSNLIVKTLFYANDNTTHFHSDPVSVIAGSIQWFLIGALVGNIITKFKGKPRTVS